MRTPGPNEPTEDFPQESDMVKALHAGVDRLLIAWAGLTPHHALAWVDPPPVNPDIPLGDVLPAPSALDVTWPRDGGPVEVDSPAPFLGEPNARWKLQVWPAGHNTRGTAVLVPPWKTVAWGTLMPVVRGLQKLGFDVLGYPTPFHLERSIPGAFSGEYFITFDMPRTGWAVRMAALELCSVVEWARARGPVTLVGLSLGGYLAALQGVVAPLYPGRALAADRMLLVVPPESILDTLMHTAIGERYRRLLEKAGGKLPDAHVLEHLARPFSPARFASSVPGRRVLVAAGTHDHFVPLESSRRLAAGLGARLHEYATGHVTSLVATRALWRDARDFLLEED